MNHLASVVLLNIYQEVAQEHSLKPTIIITHKERSPVSDSAGEPFFSEQSYSQIGHLFGHSDLPGRISANPKTLLGCDDNLMVGFEALSGLHTRNGLDSLTISPMDPEKEKETKPVASTLRMKASLTPDSHRSTPRSKPKQVTVAKPDPPKPDPPKPKPKRVMKLERSNSLPVQKKTFDFEAEDDEDEIPFEEKEQELGQDSVPKNKRLNLPDERKGRRHSTMVPMKGGVDNNNKANNNNKTSNNNNTAKNKDYSNSRKRKSIIRATSLKPKKSHFYYLSQSFADTDNCEKTENGQDGMGDLPMNRNVNLICPNENEKGDRRKSHILRDFEAFKKQNYVSHFNALRRSESGSGSEGEDLFASESQNETLVHKSNLEADPINEPEEEEEEEESMADRLEAALRKRELEGNQKKFQRMKSVEVAIEIIPETAQVINVTSIVQPKPEPKPEPKVEAKHSRETSAPLSYLRNQKTPRTALKHRGASVVEPVLPLDSKTSAPNTPQRPKTNSSSPTNFNFSAKPSPTSKASQKTESSTNTKMAKSTFSERTGRLNVNNNAIPEQRQQFKSADKKPVENKRQPWSLASPRKILAPVTKTERTSTTHGYKSPGIKSGNIPVPSKIPLEPTVQQKSTEEKPASSNANEMISTDKSFTKNFPETDGNKYIHLKSFLEDGNQLDESMDGLERVEPYEADPACLEPFLTKIEPIEAAAPSNVYLKVIDKILEEPESPLVLKQKPLQPSSPLSKQSTGQSPKGNSAIKGGFTSLVVYPADEKSPRSNITGNISAVNLKKSLPPSLFEDNTSPKQAPSTINARSPKMTSYSNNSGPNTPSKPKARLAINQFQPKKPTHTTSYSAKNASLKESAVRVNSETDAPREPIISPKETKPIYSARSPLRNLLGQAETEKQGSAGKTEQRNGNLSDMPSTFKSWESKNNSSVYKKFGGSTTHQFQQTSKYQSVYSYGSRNTESTKAPAVPDAEKSSTSMVSSPAQKDRPSYSSYASRNSGADNSQKSRMIGSKVSPANVEPIKEVAQRTSVQQRTTVSAQQKYRTGSPQYGNRSITKGM